MKEFRVYLCARSGAAAKRRGEEWNSFLTLNRYLAIQEIGTRPELRIIQKAAVIALTMGSTLLLSSKLPHISFFEEQKLYVRTLLDFFNS